MFIVQCKTSNLASRNRKNPTEYCSPTMLTTALAVVLLLEVRNWSCKLSVKARILIFISEVWNSICKQSGKTRIFIINLGVCFFLWSDLVISDFCVWSLKWLCASINQASNCTREKLLLWTITSDVWILPLPPSFFLLLDNKSSLFHMQLKYCVLSVYQLYAAR